MKKFIGTKRVTFEKVGFPITFTMNSYFACSGYCMVEYFIALCVFCDELRLLY